MTFGAPLPIKLKRLFSSVTCCERFGDNCSLARLLSLAAAVEDDDTREDKRRDERAGRGVDGIDPESSNAVPGIRGGDDKKNADGGEVASEIGGNAAETAAIVVKYLTDAASLIRKTVSASEQFDPLFIPISRKNNPLEEANVSASVVETALVIPSKHAIII